MLKTQFHQSNLFVNTIYIISLVPNFERVFLEKRFLEISTSNAYILSNFGSRGLGKVSFAWKFYLVSKFQFYWLVMGSIEESRYRYSIDTLAKVSIVLILVSIPKYPSENPHHELHIHKLVTYFDFQTSFFEFFRFLRHLPYFCPFLVISFYFFWGGGIFGHYSSDNTKYRYLNKVSILNDTKRYRYSIDIISHHYYWWFFSFFVAGELSFVLCFLSNEISFFKKLCW